MTPVRADNTAGNGGVVDALFGPSLRLLRRWFPAWFPCDTCDGTGCPCMRMRDWQSIEYGCSIGCTDCGRWTCPNARPGP